MLAWLPSESLDVAFAHTKRYTPLTLTRRKDIERDLEETRGRGYSINRGEFRAGVCGIGVPVRDRTGGVIAAPVQCDVDGIPKGSHYVRVPIATGLSNAGDNLPDNSKRRPFTGLLHRRAG